MQHHKGSTVRKMLPMNSIKHMLEEPGSDVMPADGHDVHITTQRVGNAMRVALAVDLQSVGQRRAEAMLCTAEQALCGALESRHLIAFHIDEPLDPRTRALHHRVVDGWLVAFYTVSL